MILLDAIKARQRGDDKRANWKLRDWKEAFNEAHRDRATLLRGIERADTAVVGAESMLSWFDDDEKTGGPLSRIAKRVAAYRAWREAEEEER